MLEFLIHLRKSLQDLSRHFFTLPLSASFLHSPTHLSWRFLNRSTRSVCGAVDVH